MPWLIFLLLALLVVLVGLTFHALRHAKHRREALVPPLTAVLPEGVAVRPRMLLYFYSEHCVACRTVTPLVEALHRQDDSVVKLDVRRHLMTARHLGVTSTPSLVLLEHGRIAGVHVGGISEVTLQQFYGSGNGRYYVTTRSPKKQ